jgi:feruloyl esterase
MQNSSYLSQATFDLITSAVLDECDSIDGVEDGVIENPLLCNFNIESLTCNSSVTSDNPSLSPAHVAAVNAIYAGPTSTLDGTSIYPGSATAPNQDGSRKNKHSQTNFQFPSYKISSTII